jgi:hypothetical protein
VVSACRLFAAIGNYHIAILAALPQSTQRKTDVIKTVRDSDSILNLDLFKHSLWILVQTVDAKLNVLLMLVPEPAYLGGGVHSFYWILVSPNIIFGLVLAAGLHCFNCIALVFFLPEVVEPEPGVVEGSLLNDAEHLGVKEGLDAHLGDVIEEVVEVDGSSGPRAQVDEVDVVVGHVHHNHLVLVEHAEEVDDVRVLLDEKDLPVAVHMDDGLVSARIDHFGEDEGVVEGSGEAEDLRNLRVKDQVVVLLDQPVPLHALMLHPILI